MDGFEQTTELWVRIGIAIAVIIAAWLLNRLIRRSIRHFSQRYELPKKDPGAETRFRMIGRLTSVVLYFIAFGAAFWIINVSAFGTVAAALLLVGMKTVSALVLVTGRRLSGPG